MKMVKKRVAELEGAQLDWAVATTLGWMKSETRKNTWVNREGVNVRYVYGFRPSSDWKYGGPIIERERIGVNYSYSSVYGAGYWVCMVPRGEYADTCTGQTPLIAAMRAFVASKLGDEVGVPE